MLYSVARSVLQRMRRDYTADQPHRARSLGTQVRKSLPIFPFREGLIEAVREYQARHWPVGSYLTRSPLAASRSAVAAYRVLPVPKHTRPFRTALRALIDCAICCALPCGRF